MKKTSNLTAFFHALEELTSSEREQILNGRKITVGMLQTVHPNALKRVLGEDFAQRFFDQVLPRMRRIAPTEYFRQSLQAQYDARTGGLKFQFQSA